MRPRPRRGGPARAPTRALLGALATIATIAAIAAPALARPAAAAELRGRVALEVPGVAIRDVGPVVVYLERIDGRPGAGPTRTDARISQEGARFSPAFLVVARGEPVDMPNADAIYHNVFSFSRPNDFDLGLYPAGESRTVRFAHAGVVKIYCSIHESMNATILVAPEPHHAIVAPSGRFVIEDVPPGRYRLTVWCERLAGTSTEVVVADGAAEPVQVPWAPLGP